jgi:hypothetical protein
MEMDSADTLSIQNARIARKPSHHINLASTRLASVQVSVRAKHVNQGPNLQSSRRSDAMMTLSMTRPQRPLSSTEKKER